MTGSYGPEEKHSRRMLRGQLFSKGKLLNKFVSLSVPWFFNTFVFYCQFVCRALFVERMEGR